MQGGILINILRSNGSVLHKLFDDWDKHNDTTYGSVILLQNAYHL